MLLIHIVNFDRVRDDIFNPHSCQSGLLLDLIISLRPVIFLHVAQQKEHRSAFLWVSV